MTLLSEALTIATRSLRSCYVPSGILAGGGHFVDFWVRDFCFAAWGAMKLKDYDTVRSGLDTCLGSLADDGQTPLRIGCSRLGQIGRLLGLSVSRSRTVYRQDKGLSRPQDTGALVLITLARYASEAPDGSEYIYTHRDAIHRIYRWYETQMRDGLLWGGAYATWKDSIRMRGATCVNNILLIAAYEAMTQLASMLGDDPVMYQISVDTLQTRFREVFWTGEYFAEWYDGQRHDTFAPDANILAISLGVATPEESENILRIYREHPTLAYPFGAQTNAPAYRLSEIFLPYALFGMADYQNAMRWTWIGMVAAVAMVRCGYTDMARDELSRIAQVIVRHDRVYEVYEVDGSPVSRRWYTSESPFAWGSGLYVWAYASIEGHGM